MQELSHLRVLILEDKATEAELLTDTLLKSGFKVECTVVATKSDYVVALDKLPDLILSDFSLPEFNGLEALDLLRQQELDVPFILISGAIGEQTAVEAIKRGADDFLIKDRLSRLGIAVTQALSNKRVRDERKRAEQEQTKLLHDLRERVNESTMMNRIFNLLKEDQLSEEELFQRFVQLVPPEWPRPQIVVARLKMENRDYVSSEFENAVWKQSAEFATPHGPLGVIEVGFVAPIPVGDFTSFLVDDHQQIKTLSEMLKDCLERRHAKRILSRDSQLLASIEDSAVVTNRDGIVTYWNAGATRLFGWTVEEMLGQHWLKRYPEENRAWIANRFQNRTDGNERLEEFLDWRKDGTRVWIDVRVTRILEAGQVVGVVAVSREITARKKTEVELRDQQVLLSNAERIANVGSWEMDLQTMQLTWSDQTCRIFGLQSNEFAGTFDALLSQIHVDDRQSVLAKLSFADAGGGIIEQDYRILRPNGEERVLQERGEVAFDSTGNAIRRIGVVIDITERERNIASLRKSEERYQLAVNGSTAGLWDWDLATNEVYYAQRFKELLGYNDTEFPNLFSSFSGVLHPDDQERVVEAIADAMNGRKAYCVKYRLRTKAGDYLWFDARGAVLRDQSGHPYRMAGSILDVTDQINMELELRHSEQQQRLLISQLEKEMSRLAQAQTVAKVGSWETDLTTLNVIWSDEIYRIFEIEQTKTPVTHASFLEFVHPDDRSYVNEAFLQSLKSQSTNSIEHRILLEGGTIKWIEEYWQPFFNDDGTGKYAIGTCRDITKAKFAEFRLTEHARRLEAAAAVAAAFSDQLLLADSLQACTVAMVKHLDAAMARIWTLDESGSFLNLQAEYGPHLPLSASTISLLDFPIETIARERQPYVVTDIAKFPGLNDSEWVEGHGISAIAGYPLTVGDRCVGVVELFLCDAPSQDLQVGLAVTASNIAANIERKRAEENLRSLNEQLELRVEARTTELMESSRRHKTLLANLQGMAYRCRNDDDWSMEFVSEGCRDLLGIAPQDLTNGKYKLSSLVHPEDFPIVAANFDIGLRSATPVQHEYRVRLPDGQLKWVWCQARGVYAQDGTCEAIEGFISDVTARKLRELRENYQSKLLWMLAADEPLDDCLATLAASVVAEDNALQCTIMLLDKTKQRLQCRASSNLTEAYTQAIHESIIGLKETPFGVAAHTKKLFIEHDVQTGSYGKDWMKQAEQAGIRSCWSIPVLSVDNELLGTLDIYTSKPRTPNTIESDRMEWAAELARLAIQHAVAKEALVDSESFNRATLDALSVQIAVLNSTGQIVATNQAWKDFATANGAKWQLVSEGQNYLTICAKAAASDDNTRMVLAEMREILSGTKKSWSYEYSCHSPVEERWFNGSIRRFHIKGEAHALVAHENQTNIKKTEIQLRSAMERAEQASLAKSEFLATMSHELRTPLNGILGMNELLLTTKLSSQQKQFVEACDASGRLLLQLVSDVLDLAKIESGKFELDLQECVLAKIVDDLSVTASPLAKQKRLHLHCQLAPELYAIVRCDDNRLRQIFVNLVGNAMKFTEKGGITIEGRQVATVGNRARFRFSVTDTGEGIPDARRNRLFKPFSQMDSSTTRRFGGTGLGLSICKQLVDLMDGQIGVESQVGVGSTFWFEIPLDVIKPASKETGLSAVHAPIDVASHHKPLSHVSTLSGHILVAEDNPINQLYLRELLKHFGCTYVLVTNGDEAVAAWNSDRYDLILMDCQMPEMDGFTAAREIRKREATAKVSCKIPIIALTANALKGDRERCLSSGMDEYLSKPVQTEQLLNILQIYLRGTASISIES